MTKEFYAKHKDTIDSAIKNGAISYNMNSSKNGTVAVHCYDITTKNVSISVYAGKNNLTHSVSKYILKIKIASDTKDKKQFAIAKDSADFASSLYHKLSAKHNAQIAKTQLKKNFHNTAFVKKR